MSKYIITLSLPEGCQSNKAIDSVLSKPQDKRNLEPAVIEYEGLLKQEYFSQLEDIDGYKNTRRTFDGLSIHGYTDFGMELARKYPTSQLIKIINNTYRTYGDKDTRAAMAEFNTLQEVTKARNELLKMRGNQTYHGNNVASGLHTMKPGQVLYDSKQSSLGGSSQPVTSTEQPLVVNGQRYIHENMYRELKNRATIQENDIKDFQKEVREKDKYIDDLINSLSGFASKALTEGNPDFTDLSYKKRPTRIAEAFHNVYDDEWTTALKALTHSKKGSSTPSEEDAIISLMKILQAKKGVDNTETTASEQTDINIAISPNRFAQCPIVDGQWSSEKDAELLSLQEQNKSYAESMVTMLKAKRIKEDENSKLKTRVQQLERDFQKKAKEVDSLKIVKQTLEERLNKQSKE